MGFRKWKARWKRAERADSGMWVMQRKEIMWSKWGDDDDDDSPSLPPSRFSGVRFKKSAFTLRTLSTTLASTFLAVMSWASS